jgi:hypothetical protein
MYRSPVICFYLFIRNGDLSISADRGRREPEVTSPFDSSTTVSY